MDKLKQLYTRHKEMILYVFFGGLTTVVNIAVNAISVHFLSLSGITTATIPAAIAWVVSVFFAYITNRKWVFESKKTEPKEVLGEVVSFFGFRLFSGVIDILFMYLTVDVLFMSNFWMKLLSNVVVVILNYIFSKLFIFKKNDPKQAEEPVQKFDGTMKK